MLADDVIRNFEVQKFCLFNAQKVLPDQFAPGTYYSLLTKSA